MEQPAKSEETVNRGSSQSMDPEMEAHFHQRGVVPANELYMAGRRGEREKEGGRVGSKKGDNMTSGSTEERAERVSFHVKARKAAV